MTLGRMQQRRDTASNWASNNPTLAAGEIGVDTTNAIIKIGDGVTAWSSLAVFGVALTGDQTIAGSKTFTDGIVLGDTVDMDSNAIARLSTIYDENFNASLEFGSPAGTIVNHFQVIGSTTGVNPSLSVVGETNAGLNFNLNGTGRLTAGGVNVPTVSSTDALTNKDLSTGNTFPTFNQNSTGSAAKLTTARTLRTDLASTSTASFDGSANATPGVTGTLAVGNGGTGATSLAGAGIVVSGGALGTPASGTLTNCTFPTLNQNTSGTAANVTGTVAIANGGTGATTLAGAAITVGSNNGTPTGLTLWKGTAAQYTALGSGRPSTTIYIVTP